MVGASLLDNYELEEDVENEMYSLSDKMVHYIGGEILPEHWNACKAVLVFQAGCLVNKLSTMTKTNMQRLVWMHISHLSQNLTPFTFQQRLELSSWRPSETKIIR